MSRPSSPMEIESSSEIEVTASVSIQPLPNDGDSTVSNDLSANTDVEFQAFMRAMDEHASAVISSPERYRPIRKPSPVNKQLNKEAELDFQKSTVAAQKKFQLKSKTKLNIKIKNVKLTAKWRWLDKDDTCGICRSPYESCCSSCKMPGNDCPLAIAECRHAFHMHCIRKWVRQQARSSCPLCRYEWRSPPISIFNIHPDELLHPPERYLSNRIQNTDSTEENVALQNQN